MSEPTPVSSTEKSSVVTNAQLCRLWTFTYISIGLNVVILTVFLICAIAHHHGHHKHHGFGDRDGQGGFYGMERGENMHGFHHFGDMDQGWGKPGGFGGCGQGSMGFGGQGPMNMGGDPGMSGNGGPGMMNGGPGMMNGGNGGMMGHGGFGMRGMMGGGPGEMPDPSKMTDMMLNRLSTQLTLTDDQKAKIKPIILDQVTQMQKDMEARRAAMQKAMEDTKAKLKAILNADQQKQLDAIPLPGEKPAPSAPTPAAAK